MKKKREGSCSIVKCRGNAKHWMVRPGNRPQHVCDDCKEYMAAQLKWHKATAAAQLVFEKANSE